MSDYQIEPEDLAPAEVDTPDADTGEVSYKTEEYVVEAAADGYGEAEEAHGFKTDYDVEDHGEIFI
jgi:hypothetical protein